MCHIVLGMQVTFQVNIAPNGRLSLPAELRKRLGLEDGGSLLIEETEDGLIVRTVAQSVAHAQELMRRYAAEGLDISVDSFLAHRKADSGE